MLDEQLPSLDLGRIAPLRLRQRRQRERIVEHERRLHQLRFNAGLEDFVHQPGTTERGDFRGRRVVPLENVAQLGVLRAREIYAGVFSHQCVIVFPRKRTGERQRGAVSLQHGAPEQREHETRQHFLGQLRHVVVIRVRLIPLRHRELGIVEA